MAVGADVDRRRSDELVRLRLRQRAAHKVALAERLAVLQLQRMPHEEARWRMGLTVSEYRAVRRWLKDAVDEADASDGLLRLHEALDEYAARHVEGVIRLALLRARGSPELEIRARLRITREQYRTSLEWWREAQDDAPGFG